MSLWGEKFLIRKQFFTEFGLTTFMSHHPAKKNPNPFTKHYISLLVQKFGEKQQIAEISI